jgi:hypothetical protein
MGTKFRLLTGADAVGREQVVRAANEAMAEVEAGGGRYVASHWSATGYGGGGGGSHVHYALVLVYDDGRGGGGGADAAGHGAEYGAEEEAEEDGDGFDYGDGRA